MLNLSAINPPSKTVSVKDGDKNITVNKKSSVEYPDNGLFLYDRSINNEATTVRLYTVTIDDDYQGQIKDLKLLAKGILKPNENVGYNITNSWQDGDSGIIDGLINSVGNMLTSRTGNMATEAISGIADLVGAKKFSSSIQEFHDKYQSAHITSVSNLMKSFKGTTVDVSGADSITFTLIADTTGVDIVDRVSSLKDVCMGNLVDTGIDLANSWFSVTSPPNDYAVSWSSGIKRGAVMRGTLLLNVGSLFQFTNLLVSKLSVQFSPVGILDFSTGSPRRIAKPLMATITIDLEYSRIIMPVDLDNIFKPSFNA